MDKPMKISSLSSVMAGILMSCFTIASHGQDLHSPWRLRVMDMRNQVKVEATIRFTNETAESCMAGSWKRVIVETKATQTEEFFPLGGPLAYRMEHGLLTLGRTERCDDYLFLTGTATRPIIKGSYDAVGWGSTKLGSFSLTKLQ
jgi:hypothetical protein